MPESELEESKENQSPRGGDLPYRSVFAVLTLDSVLVYDTHHDRPLAIARGLHYAGLTDCCWSQDGLNLMVCSTDGYISILSFEDGELGKVYIPPPLTTSLEVKGDQAEEPVADHLIAIVPPEDLPTIPPCEPGQSATLEVPPAKRAKKTRVTPTLISVIGDESSPEGTDSSKMTPSKRALAVETDSVGDAVNKLTLDNARTADATQKPLKKKKRIQPLLISN